jgi:hypothetical protein
MDGAADEKDRERTGDGDGDGRGDHTDQGSVSDQHNRSQPTRHCRHQQPHIEWFTLLFAVTARVARGALPGVGHLFGVRGGHGV